MEFTGERFVPGTHGLIELEHLHRYLQASRIAAGKEILDIASGEGYGSAMLAAHATRVVGVDISPEAIEHARFRYRRDNLEFRVGSCADIPLPDASVDLVVSFETLEHHDQHSRMMQEVKRVLRPGGLLLLSSPDKLHYTVEPGRLNPFHVRELYKNEFEELLAEHFANIAYFAQRVFYGSGIFSSQLSGPLNSYLLSKEIIKEFPGLMDPTYWIALASDGPLPTLTSSLLEQPLDEAEIQGQLKHALADRDAGIADVSRHVADGEAQIDQLKHALVDRDARIADITRQIADGQAAIDQLTDAAAEAEAQARWQKSLLRAAAFTPLSLHFPNAWVGHLPFAAWLIEMLSPSIFVELGTHSGNSFFSFCQAVAQSGISTRCYAVDTWQGDEHASQYDESIFAGVSAHQQDRYPEFSRLLRMTFDEARSYFSDESVALLHIDGLHTYEAVRWDFESWLPKLAPGAVVLFHDTNVRERNFGVWKLWEELQATYPLNLEFVHSHGLGVLQLNNAPEHARVPWLAPGSRDKQTVVEFFASLGSRHIDRAKALELQDHVAKLDRLHLEQDGHIVWRDGQIAELTRQLAERDEEVSRMISTRSWRLTSPLRALRRSMRDARSVTAASHRNAVAPDVADTTPKAELASIFDVEWYLKNNPNIGPGRDPLEHFVQEGGREGRSPHPLFDAQWYLDMNPDVREAGVNPLFHFVRNGWKEGRNPHPLFDVPWYLETYPDVRAAQVNPLVHFLEKGWSEGRSPSPGFDLPSYLEIHADVRTSGMNPLIHYIEHGAAEGRKIKPDPQSSAGVRTSSVVVPAVGVTSALRCESPGAVFDIAQYLPQRGVAPSPPSDIAVDVIVPVYRGLEETRRCLTSVLSDTDRPRGLVRVIDDCSPDTELAQWLASLAARGAIVLHRNAENLGFVRTINRGVSDAGRHDVLLLNSDTEVTTGFLRRLAGHAYSRPNIASVTPFSNAAGEFAGFPDKICRMLPPGYSLTAIDNACQESNSPRSLDIPTGVGFCMYIRRACLDEVGLFDADAFGRGYGEETDFCQRALGKGWRHLLACNTFVYHKGEVSFGQDAPERATSWNTLIRRHPGLPAALRSHLDGHPTVPAVFAATAALFHASPLPTVLMLSHGFDADNVAHIDDLMGEATGAANVLALCAGHGCFELSAPSIPGHPTLKIPETAVDDLSTFLQACSVSRVHIQHWIGFEPVLHELIDRLGVPLDLTVHDYFSV